jgi:transportin-3
LVFEASFLPDYLWVASKYIRAYGANENCSPACQKMLQRLNTCVFTKFDENDPKNFPDGEFLMYPWLNNHHLTLLFLYLVIEDYFRLITITMDTNPDLIFSNTDICNAFQFAFHCFTISEERPLASVFTFYRRFLSFKDKIPAPVIPAMFQHYGVQLTINLFNGLIDHFHQDSIPDVAALLKSMAENFPEESSKWMMAAVEQVPIQNMPVELKMEFMTSWTA